MEKDFETVLLLDTYGLLLTEKQQRLCDMYYNQDYSLAEIAQIEDSTRQAARDGIGKARQKLLFYEQCLGLSQKRERTLDVLGRMRALLEDRPEAVALIDEITDIWEK